MGIMSRERLHSDRGITLKPLAIKGFIVLGLATGVYGGLKARQSYVDYRASLPTSVPNPTETPTPTLTPEPTPTQENLHFDLQLDVTMLDGINPIPLSVFTEGSYDEEGDSYVNMNIRTIYAKSVPLFLTNPVDSSLLSLEDITFLLDVDSYSYVYEDDTIDTSTEVSRVKRPSFLSLENQSSNQSNYIIYVFERSEKGLTVRTFVGDELSRPRVTLHDDFDKARAVNTKTATSVILGGVREVEVGGHLGKPGNKILDLSEDGPIIGLISGRLSDN